MRIPLLLLFVLSFSAGRAQLNNWDPSWYPTDTALVFHDDLDYYLNAYSKNEIKKMRKQVNIWHMNFDKLMRATIRDLRTYSEGGGMVPRTHDFTLPIAQNGSAYTLECERRARSALSCSAASPTHLPACKWNGGSAW